MRRIIIYGTGNYGKKLLDFMLQWGVTIDCFAQTEKPAKNEIDGVGVVSLEELIKMDDEIAVFLAVKNRKVVNEIRRNIEDADRGKIKIFNFGNFIEENLDRKSGSSCGAGGKYCLICGNEIDEFEPAGVRTEIFNEYHIIGGGYRRNCICPLCGSTDRERWLYYLINKRTNINRMEGRILHFAPEVAVSNLIKNNCNIDYYTADVDIGRAMHTIDMTDMLFRDETFDYILNP